MKTLIFILVVMTCCITTGCASNSGCTAVQPAIVSNEEGLGADQGVPAPAPNIYSYRHVNDDNEDLLKTIEDRVKRVKRILNSF